MTREEIQGQYLLGLAVICSIKAFDVSLVSYVKLMEKNQVLIFPL